MRTNQELIDHLLKRNVLVTRAIIDAFIFADRAHFVRSLRKSRTYGDHPLSIGHGQTISQPFTVAFMLEELQPQRGDRVLDVGSGSGWTTALLAHIVGGTGSVTGTEIVPSLVAFGQHNLSKFNFPQAAILSAGKVVGRPGEQFDKILVSAAADDIPKALVAQLKVGGRMVIPVRSSIYRIDRVSEKEVHQTEHIGFAFVPLIQ